MSPALSSPRSALSGNSIALLVEELTGLLQQGDAGGVEAFLAVHPEQAADLRQLLPALQGLAELEKSGLASEVLDSSRRCEGDASGVLGDFRIHREVGRGGMGIVYEATQISLNRRVALKVLPFASTLDSRQLQRFKNEAQAAACLHHTNIVPVFATGVERGVHFYAMQFIEGHTLAEVIDGLRESALGHRRAGAGEARMGKAPAGPPVAPPRQGSPAEETTAHGGDRAGDRRAVPSLLCGCASTLSPAVAGLSTQRSKKGQAFFRSVAELGIQAAEALEHAHQIGIVHRDVKPANLMLDSSSPLPTGEGPGVMGATSPRLWVTDFGLAQFQSDSRLTMTGDLLGTLRYMSPEQALANRVIVDHRTDVYSLGITLYELLTLEPAFDGKDRQEILRRIAFEEPKPPRKISRAIPGELETVVLKAMEKDPGQRYGSAKDLADDLRRYLLNEPVRARRPSVIHKTRKWVRRHRSLIYSAVILVLAAALILAGSIGWVVRDRDIRRSEAEGRLVGALQVAEPLLQQGNPHHPELVSIARKAEAELAAALVGSELEQRANRMRSDLAMLDALEQARLERSALTKDTEAKKQTFDWARGAAAYAQAFEEYGVDVQRLPVDVAAASIRERTIAVPLAAALDDWAALLLRDQRQKEAEHLLAIARQVDPDDWRNRLRSALQSNDRKAMEVLTRDAPVERLPAATLVLHGATLVHMGSNREAVDLLARAQPRFPGDFWINHNLGIALRGSDGARLAEAAGYLRSAVALRPQSPGARLNLGNVLRENGKLDEAITEFREAVRLRPTYVGARSNLGGALRDRGRSHEALPHLQEASRLQPESSWLHLGLGYALGETGRLDEAEAAFKETIRLLPDDVEGYTGIGWILEKKGMPQLALEYKRKGLAAQEERVAKSPGDSGHLHRLAGMQNNVAIALMELGSHAEAESLLRRAIATHQKLLSESSTNPGYREYLSNMHNNLGDLLATMGKHGDAETELRHALTHRTQLVAEVPTRAQYRERLATVHSLLGNVLLDQKKEQEGESQYSAAMSILKQLVADFPKVPDYRFHVAVTHHNRASRLQAQGRHAEAHGEFGNATSLLKQLVEQFPSTAEYKKELTKCRPNLANSHQQRASNLQAEEKHKEAQAEFGNAIALLKDLIADFPSDTKYKERFAKCRSDLANAHHRLAVELLAENRRAEATVECRQAISLLKQDIVMSLLRNRLFAEFSSLSEHNKLLTESRNTLLAAMNLRTFADSANGRLSEPRHILFGPDGHLYVASKNTDEVLRYDGATGAFLGVVIPATAGLDHPWGMAFGPDGNLYVTGVWSHNVIRCNMKNGTTDQFIAPGSAGLKIAKGIAFGPDGNVYVSSADGRRSEGGEQVEGPDEVLRFQGPLGSSPGAPLPAPGQPGAVFVTDGSGGLDNPGALAFGPDGRLYVGNTRGDSINRYEATTGAFVDVFVPTGSGGLDGPGNVVFHGEYLYVSSGWTNRVIRYNAKSGAVVSVVTQEEPHGLNPFAIAFDRDGNLYVTDRETSQVLRYVSPTQAVGLTTFISAEPSVLKHPKDPAFGPDRNGDQVQDLYVVGTGSDNVVVYDGKTGALIEEFISPGSGLLVPAWLMFGPDGDLYVSTASVTQNRDSRPRHTVLRIDQKTKTVRKFISRDNPGGNGGLLGAKGMVFGPDGHFYVASAGTHQVLRFDGSTGRFMNVFIDAGSGGLKDPAKVLLGPDRNNDAVKDFYVGSSMTDQILVFSGVDGSPLGEFVAAGSGGLKRPHDMEFGPDGHLYVVANIPGADSPRVLRFDGTTGAFIDVVIPGVMVSPTAFITFDSQGQLYFSCESAHEVFRRRQPESQTLKKSMP